MAQHHQRKDVRAQFTASWPYASSAPMRWWLQAGRDWYRVLRGVWYHNLHCEGRQKCSLQRQVHLTEITSYSASRTQQRKSVAGNAHQRSSLAASLCQPGFCFQPRATHRQFTIKTLHAPTEPQSLSNSFGGHFMMLPLCTEKVTVDR